MGALGAEYAEAVALLLQDGDQEVRRAAVAALGSMGARGAEFVEVAFLQQVSRKFIRFASKIFHVRIHFCLGNESSCRSSNVFFWTT